MLMHMVQFLVCELTVQVKLVGLWSDHMTLSVLHCCRSVSFDSCVSIYVASIVFVVFCCYSCMLPCQHLHGLHISCVASAFFPSVVVGVVTPA